MRPPAGNSETELRRVMLDDIAAAADFLSLGTNDLLCYLFGRERR
jgi:phosphoenolpyruvate-protein kinase (PTS system EI component)